MVTVVLRGLKLIDPSIGQETPAFLFLIGLWIRNTNLDPISVAAECCYGNSSKNMHRSPLFDGEQLLSGRGDTNQLFRRWRLSNAYGCCRNSGGTGDDVISPRQ